MIWTNPQGRAIGEFVARLISSNDEPTNEEWMAVFNHISAWKTFKQDGGNLLELWVNAFMQRAVVTGRRLDAEHNAKEKTE